ncbi:hypothetical protein, partial [Bacillus manliponensis]|uniref:hypothetical protein n=1 Tax=Bacillus manliponensis TaxID=574376 RepID=UPI0039EF3952
YLYQKNYFVLFFQINHFLVFLIYVFPLKKRLFLSLVGKNKTNGVVLLELTVNSNIILLTPKYFANYVIT